MASILYTTTEGIRSTLGIDEADMSDVMLLNQKLDLLMLERLDEVFPGHATPANAQDTRRLELWCQLFGALFIVDCSKLGIPQKIQANNDALSRYNVDWKSIADALKYRMLTIESKLGSFVSLTSVNVLGVSPPGYDPVTGV